jgi:hypothetical protein
VIYLCAPDSGAYLRRAVERTRSEGEVLILPLTLPDVELPRPESHESGALGQAVKGRRPDPEGVDGQAGAARLAARPVGATSWRTPR